MVADGEPHYGRLFIIGAMKSGTTSLSHHLSNFHGLSMCSPKEPGFFSRDDVFERGLDWYAQLFSVDDSTVYLGDASTCYSRYPTYPLVFERIHRLYPEAKFIYLMRDPVKRAYSHYKHRMQEARIRGEKIISFSEAIESDEEMMAAVLYHMQIEKLLTHFPRQSLLCLKLEDLNRNPSDALDAVAEHLGLQSPDVKDDSIKNKSGSVYSKVTIQRTLRRIRRWPLLSWFLDRFTSEQRKWINDRLLAVGRNLIGKKLEREHDSGVSVMTDEDRKVLLEYYRKDSTALAELLGREFSVWSY